MKYLVLPLLALVLMCAGCTEADKVRLEQDLTILQTKAEALQSFIDKNQPVIDSLVALAKTSGDPKAAAVAAELATAVAKAQAALPAVEATIADTKKGLAAIQADADGKVPWYYIAGGLFLTVVPRLAAVLFPGAAPIAEVVAEVGWSLMASKKQKLADVGSTPAKA
jgi:hypothetical protein